jgi:hypothetical protein
MDSEESKWKLSEELQTKFWNEEYVSFTAYIFKKNK